MKTIGPGYLGGPTAEEREQQTKASHRWIKICGSEKGTQWGKTCHGVYRMRKKGCVDEVGSESWG